MKQDIATQLAALDDMTTGDLNLGLLVVNYTTNPTNSASGLSDPAERLHPANAEGGLSERVRQTCR
ncbi:MAG: hypothetical protein R3C45_18350 [Phycisphaerales bacterium]